LGYRKVFFYLEVNAAENVLGFASHHYAVALGEMATDVAFVFLVGFLRRAKLLVLGLLLTKLFRL
jgi:hypothetical protein